MTVLITGATGFVGSAIVRKLLAERVRVRALVRPDSPRDNIDGLEVEIVTGDLGDPDSLIDAVKGCSALYHVAADYRLWTRDSALMHATNVDGTVNLMRAAADAGIYKIVYTSSVAALGVLPGEAVADETTPVALTDMIGPYKKSKFLAEEKVRNMIADEGLPAVIVNPSAPVGPRDIKPTPTGKIIVDAASGRMPVFVDAGLNIVHVDDVAAGHLLAREKGEIGERYILGGEDMSLKDILTEVARLTGRRAPTIRLPHGAVLPVAYIAEAWTRLTGGAEPKVTVDGVKMSRKKMYFSSDKAKGALGYAPRPALEGLNDAVAWFREKGYCK